MIKKEQDNGCNRSSKKVELGWPDLTKCCKRSWKLHGLLVLPLLPLLSLGGATTNGTKSGAIIQIGHNQQIQL